MKETLIACNLRPKVRQRAARTCNLSSAGAASFSPHSHVGFFCLHISTAHKRCIFDSGKTFFLWASNYFLWPPHSPPFSPGLTHLYCPLLLRLTILIFSKLPMWHVFISHIWFDNWLEHATQDSQFRLSNTSTSLFYLSSYDFSFPKAHFRVGHRKYCGGYLIRQKYNPKRVYSLTGRTGHSVYQSLY